MAGHCANLDRPEQVNTVIIGFLARHLDHGADAGGWRRGPGYRIVDRRRRFHRRETWITRYTTSTAEESKCHLSKGRGRTGRSTGAPRPRSLEIARAYEVR